MSASSTVDEKENPEMEQSNLTMGQPQPVSFPIGLPGFEGHHMFLLGGIGTEYGPYLLLRSAQEDGPSFVIVQPYEVDVEMTVFIDNFHEALLEIENAGDVLVFLIATIDADGGCPTVNTKAPLVLNVKNWRCAQVCQDEDLELNLPVNVPLVDKTRR